MSVVRFHVQFVSAVALVCAAGQAAAELVVSDLVVELDSNNESRKDIEVWNNSEERSFVTISSAEVLNPGGPTERRSKEPDPEKLGLLVSPNRMILEAGQRKIVRIAKISSETDRERIYRITVKPVLGDVTGDQSGLKVLVGYDVLVIARPLQQMPDISGMRQGQTLHIRNDGNSSVELVNGRQCSSEGSCSPLPGKRLYAGSDWKVLLPSSGQVEYSLKARSQVTTIRF